MGKGHHFIANIMEQTAFHSEAVPGHPIVEIAGECRVLIENHNGVSAYGKEKILVKVCFGFISVTGANLEILRMTKEQLIIRGTIHSVGLQRRQ